MPAEVFRATTVEACGKERVSWGCLGEKKGEGPKRERGAGKTWWCMGSEGSGTVYQEKNIRLRAQQLTKKKTQKVVEKRPARKEKSQQKKKGQDQKKDLSSRTSYYMEIFLARSCPRDGSYVVTLGGSEKEKKRTKQENKWFHRYIGIRWRRKRTTNWVVGGEVGGKWIR